MKTQEQQNDEIRTTVRERYGRIADNGGSCGCAPTCCGVSGSEAPGGHSTAAEASKILGYSQEEMDAAPAGANLGLGCGNPHAIASLKPGERILDLGSGAGFDAFLAARAVGPTGHVIGVDMTPEMISKARRHQSTAGVQNSEFRLGEIEHLPIADSSVDVILSNCVINLSPDKAQVFREAHRVLKPGGRLAISDIVALGPIPESMRQDWELYTGCIAGASSVENLQTLLAQTGFVDIRIARKDASREILRGWMPGHTAEEFVTAATIEAVKP